MRLWCFNLLLLLLLLLLLECGASAAVLVHSGAFAHRVAKLDGRCNNDTCDDGARSQRFYRHWIARESSWLGQTALKTVKAECPHYPDIPRPHGTRERSPIFFGSLDWHSAVHSHWTLLRLSRRFPNEMFVDEVGDLFGTRFTAVYVELEKSMFLMNSTFELPYGIVWFLKLQAELSLTAQSAQSGSIAHSQMAKHLATFRPLEDLLASRLEEYINGLTSDTLKTNGQHDNAAFALLMILDYTRVIRNRQSLHRLAIDAVERLIVRRIPLGCEIEREPQLHDFLSPCLAAAAAASHVLNPASFSKHLTRLFPTLRHPMCTRRRVECLRGTSRDWLRSLKFDPQAADFAHTVGLSLSRAWFLHRISHALPIFDSRRAVLQTFELREAKRGLSIVANATMMQDYMISHYVPTFATILTTGGQ